VRRDGAVTSHREVISRNLKKREVKYLYEMDSEVDSKTIFETDCEAIDETIDTVNLMLLSNRN
jgi:hypothetical protein